jgi:Na+/H+-dicarboxylate symporter
VLPVLLLAVLCGFGLTASVAPPGPCSTGIDGFSHMLFAAFGFIMKLAPLGCLRRDGLHRGALRHQVDRARSGC